MCKLAAISLQYKNTKECLSIVIFTLAQKDQSCLFKTFIHFTLGNQSYFWSLTILTFFDGGLSPVDRCLFFRLLNFLSKWDAPCSLHFHQVSAHSGRVLKTAAMSASERIMLLLLLHVFCPDPSPVLLLLSSISLYVLFHSEWQCSLRILKYSRPVLLSL